MFRICRSISIWLFVSLAAQPASALTEVEEITPLNCKLKGEFLTNEGECRYQIVSKEEIYFVCPRYFDADLFPFLVETICCPILATDMGSLPFEVLMCIPVEGE